MTNGNKYIQFRLALDPEKDKIVIEHLKRSRNITQFIRDLVMEDYKRCHQGLNTRRVK